ncbi:MFS transporter [Brevibacillus migulae]|uniref:MFS transporter n=1 Tax=Brevibacillus migulae TaxID=1644114 RepID=UPI00106EADE7|nr:MFS transporter [Brevibacillus migulae]
MNTHRKSMRNIRILFWTSLFGSINFLEPIMTLFYFQRGLSASEVFWVTLAWCATVLLFEVPTGAFADRFGPKASFLVGAGIGLLNKVCLLLFPDPIMLYVYNILWGLSVTFFSGAEEALIYETLKEHEQEQNMSQVLGKINTAIYYPMILTFLLGPWLARDLQASQFSLLIGFNIVCQAVELILLLWIVNPRTFEKFRENPFHHIQNGWSVIRRTPDLVSLFLHFTVIFIAGTVIFGKMEQPLLIDNGLPVEYLGLFYAAIAAAGLFLSHQIGFLTQRFQPRHLLLWTGVGSSVALLIASTTPHLVSAGFAFVILRLTRVIRYPVYSQMANEYIPSQSRATTLSLLSIADSVCDLLLLTLFAGIAQWGIYPVLAGCGVMILLGSLIPVRSKQSQNG